MAVLQRRIGAETGADTETGKTRTRMAMGTTGASAWMGSGRGCTPTARPHRGPTSNTGSTMAAPRRRPSKGTTGARAEFHSDAVRLGLGGTPSAYLLAQVASGAQLGKDLGACRLCCACALLCSL